LVFAFGFFGYLAAWAGYYNDESNPNVLLFKLLANGESQAPGWIVVIVVLLAVTMNEAAVDSFQNALVDTLSTLLGRTISADVCRVAVVVVNVPLIIISLQGYAVINLFLVANIVTSTATLPMLLGLWEGGYHYIGGFGALFGCLFSLGSVIIYGVLIKDEPYVGLRYIFFEAYNWPAFMIALVASLMGLGLWVIVSQLWIRVVGLPDDMILPGFKTGLLSESIGSTENQEETIQ